MTNRTTSRRGLLGAGLATIALLVGMAAPVAGQTTFYACYVPAVGVLYIIELPGLPTDCLSPSHQKISWSEGTVADGSITTAKLANSAVTGAKIADGTVATADLANGAVTFTKLANGVAWKTYFAGVIGSTGQVILPSDPAITTARTGTGVYNFTFPQSVSPCVTVATALDGHHIPLLVNTSRIPGGAGSNVLRVSLVDAAGAPTDGAVNVLVMCL